MTTIPARVVLRSVLAGLSLVIRETEGRLGDGRTPPNKRHGIRETLRIATEQRMAVAKLLKGEPKGSIRADLAGLLAAISLGYREAWADVETITGRDDVSRLNSEHIAALCGLLMEG